MIWSFLAAIFTGAGIGSLISPAFFPVLELWNLLGFIPVAIGVYFMSRAYK